MLPGSSNRPSFDASGRSTITLIFPVSVYEKIRTAASAQGVTHSRWMETALAAMTAHPDAHQTPLYQLTRAEDGSPEPTLTVTMSLSEDVQTGLRQLCFDIFATTGALNMGKIAATAAMAYLTCIKSLPDPKESQMRRARLAPYRTRHFHPR